MKRNENGLYEPLLGCIFKYAGCVYSVEEDPFCISGCSECSGLCAEFACMMEERTDRMDVCFMKLGDEKEFFEKVEDAE